VKKKAPFIRFGSYLLVDKIASGGMADVYRARVTGLRGFSKPVAIKKIHPHLLAQRGFLNMFVDEAKIVSRLRHPNIVQILELGEVNGQPFIAMEYLPGRDLYELMTRLQELGEPCPWPLAVRVILEVASALHFAHESRAPDGTPLGIVHRDVSPRNILLSYDGEIKLTDFGVARARDREEMTQAGIIKGKVRYLSPEAALGEDVDRRSDVFSLGVVFAELLTMENFRQGPNNLAILADIRKGLDEKHRFDALPRELVNVLGKALALDRELRYPSAESFRRELLALATGPIAPMSRSGLSHFMKKVFSEEFDSEAKHQAWVEKVVTRWEKEGEEKTAPIPVQKTEGLTIPEEKPSWYGDLREISLTRVLSFLLVKRKTGILLLRRRPVEKTLNFFDGQIIDVRSNVELERFGEFLVRRGKLGRPDLERCLARIEEEKVGLTVLLLREKLLSASELFEFLSDQLHSRIFSVFVWPDGDFAFYPGEISEDNDQKLCLDTLDLILMAVSEYLPPARIRERLLIGPNSRIEALNAPDLAGFPLSGKMQRILGILKEGPKRLDEIKIGEHGESLLRTLYLLRELDLVQILPGRGGEH